MVVMVSMMAVTVTVSDRAVTVGMHRGFARLGVSMRHVVDVLPGGFSGY